MLTKIEVRLADPIGRIDPRLHGHFVEHVGAGVYGGVWDEERSCLHEGVLARLRELRPPIIRWPGGCFAETYDWRDGVGPRSMRPRRLNNAWGAAVETNAFGTHELVELCRGVGAEPYLCGNVSSGSPRELAAWVEYCNATGTTLADARGSAPLAVQHWGIGNEPWGCGGAMTAEEYAAHYARFAMPLASQPGLVLVASGPDGPDVGWTERFFARHRAAPLSSPRVDIFGLHYYVGSAGLADAFDAGEAMTLFARAHATEALVRAHTEVMKRAGARGVKLALDEWGTWHPPTPGRGLLWQPSTVRDGLVTAITLDALHRAADLVVMANLAQLVNVLMAPLCRERDEVRSSPTFDVLLLYAPHRGGVALPVEVDGRSLGTMSAVVASASITGRVATLTLVNADPLAADELCVRVCGANVRMARTDVLRAPSFDAPHFERSGERALAVSQGEVRFQLDASSVSRVTIELEE